MSALSSQYKALFREELLPRGFLLYKKTFYRVTNDVVQTLMLCKTDTNFTLDFSILPLCLPVTELYCEGYDIANFEHNRWWDCYGEVDEKTFGEILYLFRQYVMPMFERGVSAESAAIELVNYEKMIFTTAPEGVINNYYVVLMWIKAKDYEKARQYMSVIIKKRDKEFQELYFEREKKGLLSEPDWLFDRIKTDYQNLKEISQKLSIPDTEYFQRFVAKNEAISLEYLKNPNKRK